MTLIDKIKALLAEQKPAVAAEVKAEKPTEVVFSNEVPVIAASPEIAPITEPAPSEGEPVVEKDKKEEVKAATPEERIAALEAAIEEIKAAITEIATVMGGAKVEEAEMAEVKKENKVLAKKVKELSDAPAVPAFNFAKIELKETKLVAKTDLVKNESIKEMVMRMTAK